MSENDSKEYRIKYKVLVEIEGTFYKYTELNREELIKDVTDNLKHGDYIDIGNIDDIQIKDIQECRISGEWKRERTN